MARRENVTLFMALLAGWKAFLPRYTGQADIAVGSPISDRARTETEGLIGLFLNTLILRTNLSGIPPSAMRSRGSAIRPWKPLPTRISPSRWSSRISNQPANRARNPLLRVIFVLVTGEEKAWRTPDAEIVPMPIEESKAKFDLMLHLRDLVARFGAPWFTTRRSSTPRWCAAWAATTRRCSQPWQRTPETRIDSLPLSCRRNASASSTTWNDTASPVSGRPHGPCAVPRASPGSILTLSRSRTATRITYGESTASRTTSPRLLMRRASTR